MAYKISFGKKALFELEEGFLWYEKTTQEIARKFYAATLSRIDEIAHYPYHFGPLKNRPRYRRAKVKRFPFLIIVFRV